MNYIVDSLIRFIRGFARFLPVLGIVLAAERAAALGTEHIGPDTNGHYTTEQPGWFKGMIELLKHPSRVYSMWENGGEGFYFKATPEQINELIALYSKARLRDHEIVIKPGEGSVKSFSGMAFDHNVVVTTLEGISLWHYSEQDATKTYEPQMTIRTGNDPSFLAQLKFPDNVIVRSEVSGVEIKARTNLPARKAWHGRVNFEGDTPAADMEHGVTTRVIFWDSESADGIPLPGISHDGYLKVALSDGEKESLKSGKAWLTLTPGNFAAVPKKTDQRFPEGLLVLEKDKAVAHHIPRPQNYYYGRILFEDGTPPVLDPKPWPGAEISLDFAYAGRATIDAAGYFRVFLEPDQFAKLKEARPSKNIYCPIVEQGRSTAADMFRPELLSQDKATAGVVKIAKPSYMAGKTP